MCKISETNIMGMFCLDIVIIPPKLQHILLKGIVKTFVMYLKETFDMILLTMTAPSAPKRGIKIRPSAPNLGQSALGFGSRPYKMPSIFTWPPHLKVLV